MAGVAPVAAAQPIFAPAGAPGFSGAVAPPAPPPMHAKNVGGTSGVATAAMVLGIVGLPLFILVIPSLLALILGIVGVVQTSGGVKRGRGMAIAGIVLGTVVMFGWLVFGAWIVDEF